LIIKTEQKRIIISNIFWWPWRYDSRPLFIYFVLPRSCP
jgi:hypothetical protein